MIKRMAGLMAVAALALVACGKSPKDAVVEKIVEKAIEKDTGAKVDIDSGKNTMTIQTKEGDKVEIANNETGIKAPDDFPKDVFVYPGAVVKHSIKSSDGMQVGLETKDPIAKVVETYKGKMKENGWEEKTSAAMNQMTMLEYAKPQRNVMVHINTEPNQPTSIMLVVTNEQAAAPAADDQGTTPAPEETPEPEATPEPEQ